MSTMSVTRSGREQRAWAEARSAILVLQGVKPDLTDVHRPRSYVKPQTENERKTSDRYKDPASSPAGSSAPPVSLYGSSFRSQRSLDIYPSRAAIHAASKKNMHPGICSCHISFIVQISQPMGPGQIREFRSEMAAIRCAAPKSKHIRLALFTTGANELCKDSTVER